MQFETSPYFTTLKAEAAKLKKHLGIDYAKGGVDTIERMLNGLCEAMDNHRAEEKSLYAAGLMLRFWKCVAQNYYKNMQAAEFEDYASLLFEGIMYACKYRAWQDPTKDVNGQQALNQCIETIRLQFLHNLSQNRLKANFGTVSFDQPAGDADGETLGEITEEDLAHTTTEVVEADASARQLIQSYINHKNIVEAIILDTIAFNETSDCMKTSRETIVTEDENGESRTYTQTSREFWRYKARELLSKLPASYADYFKGAYSVNLQEFEVALNTIKKASSQKLYRYLDNALSSAREAIAR